MECQLNCRLDMNKVKHFVRAGKTTAILLDGKALSILCGENNNNEIFEECLCENDIRNFLSENHCRKFPKNWCKLKR